MKIMIIEDDQTIASLLAEELQTWGYKIVIPQQFNDLLSIFLHEKPHLVMLDINIPSFNGFYWCQQIRKHSNVPILFLSSRSESSDIIQAMQFGGDDYLVKPLRIDVVRAKVQALLRRTYNYHQEETLLSFHDVYLSISTAKISYQDKEISLTHTELLIMESLFRNQGKIVSREKIIDTCWQGNNFIDDNTLAVNITRLRKKLIILSLDSLIQTKKGNGYFLQWKK